MINFFKRLLGLAATPEVAKVPTAPYKIEPPKEPTSIKVNLAEPTVAKVRAITDTNPGAAAAAVAQKPANKRRRPHRGNKVKAGAKVTEGATKGGNNTVKPAQVAKAKPAAPKKPKQ
jgi:hypothetical protein